MINYLIFALLFAYYYVFITISIFTFYNDRRDQHFPERFHESFIEYVLYTNNNLNLFGNILFVVFKLVCTIPYLIIYYIFAIIITIINYIIKFLFYKKDINVFTI